MYIHFILQWTHKFSSALAAAEICDLKGHMILEGFLGSTVSGDRDKCLLQYLQSDHFHLLLQSQKPHTVVVNSPPPPSYVQLSMLWTKYFTGHMFQTFSEFNISSCIIQVTSPPKVKPILQ
jgi:hypothetical protein